MRKDSTGVITVMQFTLELMTLLHTKGCMGRLGSAIGVVIRKLFYQENHFALDVELRVENVASAIVPCLRDSMERKSKPVTAASKKPKWLEGVKRKRL